MTPADIAGGKRLVEAATAGPWEYWGGTATFAVNAKREPYKHIRVIGGDLDVLGPPLANAVLAHTVKGASPYNAGIHRWEDAQFIVWARNSLPALLTSHDALTAMVAELADALEKQAERRFRGNTFPDAQAAYDKVVEPVVRARVLLGGGEG